MMGSHLVCRPSSYRDSPQPLVVNPSTCTVSDIFVHTLDQEVVRHNVWSITQGVTWFSNLQASSVPVIL
jgi:hypothetical protein